MNWKEYLFSNRYGGLRYKIRYFLNYRLPFTKSWNKYHNPWYYWWKVRKVFKRPKSNFYYGKMTWFFGFPCRKDYLNSVLDIRFSSLGWKTKYDSYRHEWDPYISIVFFRKWQLLWIFNWIDENDDFSHIRSMATWEAMLDYLYYNKSIEDCVKENIWIGSKCGKDYEITIFPNLN